MPTLIVNLDAVAALRSFGGGRSYPDPAASAVLAELGGAAGVSVRYRPTAPFASKRDLRVLREVVQGRFVLAVPPTPETMGLALDVKPDRVTLVAEGAEATDGPSSLDLILDRHDLGEIIASIQDGGIRVDILVEPEAEQVKNAHRLNADGVQLHTGQLADSGDEARRNRGVSRVLDAARLAAKLRLDVSAGCGISYELAPRLAGSGEIGAWVVGHAVVARSLFVGMETAVRDFMVQLEAR